MNFFTRRAAERRRQTIAARKADHGCACHGQDLVLCPNYKPVVFKTKVNGFEYTAKVGIIPGRAAVSSATVRFPIYSTEVGRA